MKLFCQTYRLGPRRCASLLAFLLLASCPLNLALASGGFDYAGPRSRNGTLGYSAQSGLQIKVNSSWVGNRGYWPIRIQLSSPTASTTDRQITIRLFAGGRSNRPSTITVEQDFELAQGDTTASIKLLFPKLTNWNHCGWEVWVEPSWREIVEAGDVERLQAKANQSKR